MRPVERGPWPVDGDGAQKIYHPYDKAKDDLFCRVGEYCSYCERKGDLHVEHVIPKKRCPGLKEFWANFLLGCVNCNSIKSNNNVSRNGYVWPDEDDTYTVFEYLEEGVVRVRGGLPEDVSARAHSLFELVGLGRSPGRGATRKDLRWRMRREVWGQAQEARTKIDDGDNIDWVVMLARATGFWSVWKTVFADYPEVTERLHRCFPGTREDG